SWAYILMVGATLAGVVGLLWPSPAVRTIEEIAMPSRAPARAEAPAKPKPAPKAAAKPVRPEAAPPAVVKRMPAQTTATRRAGPLLENGLQPSTFGKFPSEREAPGAAPMAPSRPGAPASARPIVPPRPASERPAPEPAAR
ncbi:MAG: hypothetical protein ABR587_16955, partial [Candidatus Binatia bacterium]